MTEKGDGDAPTSFPVQNIRAGRYHGATPGNAAAQAGVSW